jgi:hypothetical protein
MSTKEDPPSHSTLKHQLRAQAEVINIRTDSEEPSEAESSHPSAVGSREVNDDKMPEPPTIVEAPGKSRGGTPAASADESESDGRLKPQGGNMDSFRISFQTNNEWQKTQMSRSPVDKRFEELYTHAEILVQQQASQRIETAGRIIEAVCLATGRCNLCTLVPPCQHLAEAPEVGDTSRISFARTSPMHVSAFELPQH